MSLISYLFGRRGSGGGEPWVEASIYRLIVKNIDQTTGRLNVDSVQLSDEDSMAGDGQIRWAAGAMDGVGSHHMASTDDKLTARRVAALVDEHARQGTPRPVAALHGLLKDDALTGYIDDVIHVLSEKATPVEPHLSGLALKLATRTADRGPVKFGIALLGVLRLRQHEEVVLTLGKHDEFTLFSCVALKNMFDDASESLWKLARCVDGWGRIQAVERLVPTDNADIQRWLRTEGFRNSVMYEYLAHPAAVHGRLREALAAETVTDAELIAAGEIISALISGNGAPAAGIDDYTDAAPACRAYLDHALRHQRRFTYFLTARSILGYLEADKREPAEQLKSGWSDAARLSVGQLAKLVIADPAWQALALNGLESPDEQTFHDANRVAEHIGIDTFEVHWRRVVNDPRDPGRWFNAMQRANPERINRIIEFAEANLPLEKIASGPGDALGFGPEFQDHSCLDFILQDLKPYPGKGWVLVRAGLRSPVVRNRNMALNALEGWEAHNWPPDTAEVLLSAMEKEPNAKLRQRMSALLAIPPMGPGKG